jgi:hypothetical protein
MNRDRDPARARENAVDYGAFDDGRDPLSTVDSDGDSGSATITDGDPDGG